MSVEEAEAGDTVQEAVGRHANENNVLLHFFEILEFSIFRIFDFQIFSVFFVIAFVIIVILVNPYCGHHEFRF